MNISRAFIDEVIKKANAEYPQEWRRDLSVEYSLAIQIIIESLGAEAIEILSSFFPEATRSRMELTEAPTCLEKDGFVKIRQTFGGEAKAACLARIFYFAHCILDLEKKEVSNFSRVKYNCTKKGIGGRPFERTYYEILIAARFARRGIGVEFLEESKKIKTPDLWVGGRKAGVLIECKCNVFRDLNSIRDRPRRISRILSRFEDGCKQVQQFGESSNQRGFVYVQYMNNDYIEEDKEVIRSELKRIASDFLNVMGGGFTYEIHHLKEIRNELRFHGYLKYLTSNPGMSRMLSIAMFQGSCKLPSLLARLLARF